MPGLLLFAIMLPQANPGLDAEVSFFVAPRKVHKGLHHPLFGIVVKCPLSGETQQERIMMSLAGKKIVLGVSGGIAAYKAAELVRRLRERGADVRVAITEGGKAFITPLSLQAVSGYPVSDSLLDPAAKPRWGILSLGNGPIW